KVRMQPIPCDANQIVRSALEAVAVGPETEVVPALGELPRLCMDPEQVQKVMVNLLSNAREALKGPGRIGVGTRPEGSWAVLAVTHSGCGMSADFPARSLFRPFQTTKKAGIGIGMFHCKTIVEAHRGRIEVESEVGKGTRFRVLLPIEEVVL